MSISIILSDQAATIVQAHLKDYGSTEAVIESALFKLHESDLHDGPDFIDYLNAAITEAEEDDAPYVEWNPEEFKRECYRQWKAKQSVQCHK